MIEYCSNDFFLDIITLSFPKIETEDRFCCTFFTLRQLEKDQTKHEDFDPRLALQV